MHAVPLLSPVPMDRSAFSDLILRHHRVLLSYAIALGRSENVARELVQDAFVAAWQSIGTFDVTRDFASWMRGIVRNKWRERCRLYARETPLDEAAFSRLEATLAAYPEGDSALFARLAECRQRLPGPMAAAIHACYDEGRTSEEAATVLATNAATLRKRLERAREALRLCLTREL